MLDERNKKERERKRDNVVAKDDSVHSSNRMHRQRAVGDDCTNKRNKQSGQTWAIMSRSSVINTHT